LLSGGENPGQRSLARLVAWAPYGFFAFVYLVFGGKANQVNCMTTDSQAAAKRALQHDSALHFAGFLNARAGRIAAGLAGVPDHECLSLCVVDTVSLSKIDEAMDRLSFWYALSHFCLVRGDALHL